MSDNYTLHPPINVPNTGNIDMWTFDLVQEAMVEAIELWRRSPGGGSWPFAGDGPWQWVRSLEWGDYADDDARLRPLPLSRAEVAKRDKVSGWLTYVGERDRKLVVLAIGQLATGRERVEWKVLLRPMGLKLGADGLRMRYGRALTRICNVLNRAVANCENGGNPGLDSVKP